MQGREGLGLLGQVSAQVRGAFGVFLYMDYLSEDMNVNKY